MRVLAIDEALPHPLDSGKRIRTFEMLSRLAPHFEITLAFPHEGPVPLEGERAFREAGITLRPVARRALRKHGFRFAWDLARNVALPVPYMVMAHRSRAMRSPYTV